MMPHLRPLLSPTDPHFQVAIDALSIGLLLFDRKETIIYANPPAHRLFATSPEVAFPAKCGDFIRCVNRIKDQRRCGETAFCSDCNLLRGLRAVLAGTKETTALSGETEIRRAPGASLWIKYTFLPLPIDGGNGVMLAVEDITRQRRSEQQYQTLFREMFNAFALHEILLDDQGTPVDYRFLAVNPAFERMTGLSAETIVGKTVLTVLPDTEPCWIATYGKVALTGQPVNFESHSGALDKHFAVTAFCPAPGQFACVFEEISERKRAETALRLSENRLKKLVAILQYQAKNTQDLLDHTLDQAIELTGSTIGFIYKYHEDRQELVLNSWSKEVLPACTVANPQTRYQLDRTGFWGEAVRQRRPMVLNDFQAAHPLKRGYPEGHVPLTKFMTVPIFRNDRIVGVVGLANKPTDYDDTDVLQISLLMDGVWNAVERRAMEEERQRLQTQLAQAQKMEAIGALAGGIAHDFNNVLGAILGYGQMARDASPDGSRLAYDLDKLLEAGNRAADLVRQILTFSRRNPSERVALQPAQIVKEALKLLRPALPSTIAVHQRVAAKSMPIFADPTQVHQILMNLCTNALHAMEDSGGTLEIALADYTLAPADLVLRPGLRPGEYVRLHIRDTGPGIPAEIRERIFEPYFTTKEAGKGTGMGLAIVHGIVEQHGGFITCDSTPGTGTVFEVFFPAHQEQAQTAAPVATVAAPAGGKEHILLIDDEEILVETAKAMLERLGYRVTGLIGSEDAWTTFAGDPEQFDAVITDQTMPGLTGMQLARRMLTLRPDLPIILCTGYSNQVTEDQARAQGISAFALKPLSKKELSLLLREVLDKASEPG